MAMEEKNEKGISAKNESKKTVRTFASASFLNDMGSDMIYPIWPLFVTSVLGANMAILGLIDGLGDAIVSISQAISGYVSDRTRKRKIFIWTGYACGSLSRLGYAFSSAWQHLIPFRILDRAGKMRGAPRDAIIADASTNENRGRNFGLLRAMDNLGAFVGVIICILFVGLLGYRNLFLLAAVPSVVAVVLILVMVKERKLPEKKLFKGFSFQGMDKNLKLLMVLSAFFAMGSFSYSFLLIYATKFGFQPVFIPVLYMIFTFAAFVFSLPFGKLADRMGRKPVMMISYLLWGLVCASFILFQSFVAVILIFVLYGMHKGALEPVQKAFVSELSPVNHRASSLGAYQMVIGLFALPSSLAAGVLWDTYGMFVPLYLSLGLTVVSLAMLAFVKENKASA
jgi:MFS family permease